MTQLRLIFAFICVSLMISGCSFRSGQLASLIELVQGSPDVYGDSAWIIRYGEYRAQVQALSFDDGILFSNSSNDQAFFDGWTIRRASGLGLRRGSWSVRDDPEGRHFTQRGRLTSFPPCVPWEKSELEGVVQYTQACQGVDAYSNRILVNKEGEITLIRQSLNAGVSFVTLSKK